MSENQDAQDDSQVSDEAAEVVDEVVETVDEVADVEAELGQDGQPESEQEELGTDAEVATEGDSSWVTDTVRELAASYGLSEDELADYSDESEFELFAARFEHFRKAQEAKPEEKTETPAEAPVAESQPEAEQSPPDAELESAIKAMEEKGFDEEFISPFRLLLQKSADRDKKFQETLAKELEQRDAVINQLRERHEQEAHVQRVQSFHSLVDTLDAERYGRSVDEKGSFVPLDQSKDENRRKLWEAIDLIQAKAVSDAQKANAEPKFLSQAALLKKAEIMAFGEEMVKNAKAAAKAEIVQKAKKQSAKRRPSSSSRPVPGTGEVATEPYDVSSMIEGDPEWKALAANFYKSPN